jgi:hypothetical protein
LPPVPEQNAAEEAKKKPEFAGPRGHEVPR